MYPIEGCRYERTDRALKKGTGHINFILLPPACALKKYGCVHLGTTGSNQGLSYGASKSHNANIDGCTGIYLKRIRTFFFFIITEKKYQILYERDVLRVCTGCNAY